MTSGAPHDTGSTAFPAPDSASVSDPVGGHSAAKPLATSSVAPVIPNSVPLSGGGPRVAGFAYIVSQTSNTPDAELLAARTQLTGAAEPINLAASAAEHALTDEGAMLGGPRATADALAAHEADTPDSATLQDAYDYCRRIIQQIARTFYYGSLFLPEQKRRAAWALYAFCRIADDIADEPDLYPDPLNALARWRHALMETYAGRPHGPVMRAWADALERWPVPLQPAIDLLDGVEMDVRGARYSTFDDLKLYCYRVAGTVGLLTAPILGYCDEAAPQAAVDLGIAMQLTNILRDIGEDRTRGRIYLPADELAAFGYHRDELERGVINEPFISLIEFQIARAEQYYERGMRGIALLHADARLAITLSGELYRAILYRIRRNHYDVFGRRAHIPLTGKLAILPGAWLRVRGMNQQHPNS